MSDAAPNSLNFDCDWQLGLNLKAQKKACIGYLLSFSGCGGLKLSKDIEVFNPLEGSSRTVVKKDTIECVGMIERFRFEGGDEDPVRIRCYVSKGTAADVRAKLARPLTNTTVRLSWYIVDFDPEAKLWYEAAFIKSPKEASSNVDSTGGDLQMFVENAPTTISEALDIGVFGFEFQVVPANNKSTTLEFATGPRRRLVKSWG